MTEFTQEHQNIIDDFANDNPRLFGIHECNDGCDCKLYTDFLSSKQREAINNMECTFQNSEYVEFYRQNGKL